MSRIRAVRNDGLEYSKAEGNIKTILKMLSSLPESQYRQIVINKAKLDEFIKSNKFLNANLYELKIFDCMQQSNLKGQMKRALGIGYEFGLEMYYVSIPGVNHYILNKVLIDGRVVYTYPRKINSHDGVMELSV